MAGPEERRFAWLPLLAASVLLVACGGGETKRTEQFDVEGAFAEVKAARAATEAARRSAASSGQDADYEAAYTRYQNTLARFLTVAINHAPEAPETREGLDLYADEAIRNAEETQRRGGGTDRAREVLEQARRTFFAAGREPPASLERALAGLPPPKPTSSSGGRPSP